MPAATTQEVAFRTVRFDILLAGAPQDVAAAHQTLLIQLGPCPDAPPYAPLRKVARLGYGQIVGPWEMLVPEGDPATLSVVVPLKMEGWLSQWTQQHPGVVLAVLGRDQREGLEFSDWREVAFLAVALPERPVILHDTLTVGRAKHLSPVHPGWGTTRNSDKAKGWMFEKLLRPLIDTDVMHAWCKARSLDQSLETAGGTGPLLPSRRF